MNDCFVTSRRSFIKGVGLGMSLALSTRPALAQPGNRLVIGTWGGDYARLLNKNIEQPFLLPKGFDVVQDQAGDPERRAKLAAERRLPRGSVDLHSLSGPTMYQVFKQGLTQEIDFGRIPNAVNLLPAMRQTYGVPHIYSGNVVLYNPEILKQAPGSYADILNPALGDKLGIIDNQYQTIMQIAALVAGGKLTEIDAGKKLLLDVRKAGARIYPANESFAQGLKTGEIGGGIMFKARAMQWRKAGINLKVATPSEGILPYTTGFVIARNASNPEGAYAYIDAALEAAAQRDFAIDMGYDGTVSSAGIPADVKENIGFTPEEVAKMQTLDYDFLLDSDANMKNWWDKEFKA